MVGVNLQKILKNEHMIIFTKSKEHRVKAGVMLRVGIRNTAEG